MQRAVDLQKLIKIENRDDDSVSVMIDDDGEVVWAFLLKDGKISADVWLCNRARAPDVFERRVGGGPPLNIKGFFDTTMSLPALRAQSLTAVFRGDAADLFLDDTWIAQLRLHAKPGWSLLATRSNAVARPLSETSQLGTERPIKKAMRERASKRSPTRRS